MSTTLSNLKVYNVAKTKIQNLKNSRSDILLKTMTETIM